MVCLFRELFHLSKVPFVRQFSNLSKPFSLANLKGFERSDNSMANALYIRGLMKIGIVFCAILQNVAIWLLCILKAHYLYFQFDIKLIRCYVGSSIIIL